MNLIREPKEFEPVGVRQVDAPEDLSSITRADCAAVVWHRQPLAPFQTWLDAQRPKDLPRARCTLSPDRVHAAVRYIFDASGLEACDERRMLVEDIAAQADLFASVMEAPYLRLRIEVITTNSCRKFHVDAVTARLVCTYRGTGTQYGTSLDGDDPVEVFTVSTGSPIVLRGTNWPETPASGLKHRSPPIEGIGETRLVLVLDPVLGRDDGQQQYLH